MMTDDDAGGEKWRFLDNVVCERPLSTLWDVKKRGVNL